MSNGKKNNNWWWNHHFYPFLLVKYGAIMLRYVKYPFKNQPPPAVNACTAKRKPTERTGRKAKTRWLGRASGSSGKATTTSSWLFTWATSATIRWTKTPRMALENHNKSSINNLCIQPIDSPFLVDFALGTVFGVGKSRHCMIRIET